MPIQAAERCLLAALFSNPNETYEVVRDLPPDHFASEDHRLLFSCLKQIIEDGHQVDEVTVLDALQKNGKDVPWATEAFKNLVSGPNYELANLPVYTKLVTDGSNQRKAVASLNWGLDVAKNTPLNGDTKAHIKNVADGLLEIASGIKAHDEEDAENAMPTFPKDLLGGIWKEWADTISESTEAPYAYHIASCMMAFCVAINRKAHVVSGAKLYPQFFSLIVGSTGERKTTALDRVEAALAILDPKALKFGGFGSSEGLMKAIAKLQADRPNVLILLSEAGKMLKKVVRSKSRETAGGGLSILCDLFDSANRSVDNPVQAGNDKVTSPIVSIFGASTPKISAMLYQEDALEEGFANRFVIYAGKSTTLLDLPAEPDPGKIESLCRRMVTLANQAASIGEFKLSPDARELNRQWYAKFRDNMNEANKRLQVHILKFALIHAISREATQIEAEDYLKAVSMGEYWTASANYLMANWTGSERGRAEDRILGILEKRGPMNRKELRKCFGGKVCAYEFFRDAIGHLVQQKAIIALPGGRLEAPR